MINKFKENIKSYGLIKEHDNIVIGLSGGHDSIALLSCLYKFKASLNYNLIVCHVNHGVRGLDADKDQEFTRQLARELNLPYHTINVDMVQYGKDKRISPEEAGRILRYGFFRQVLDGYGGGKIAVAHNLNDQVETVLMRIIRGTGLDGLKAMDYIQGDIIRPLLNVSRKDIEEYIEVNQLATVLDKTNLESIYTRNKIRLELIPYLEENFNPKLEDSIFKLSMMAKEDSEFIERYTREKFDSMLILISGNKLILDRNIYMDQDEAIKSRLIRMGISSILGDLNGIGESHVSLTKDLIGRGTTGKYLNIYEDIIVRLSYDEIIIERLAEKVNYSYDLGLNDSIYIEELGLRITSKLLDRSNLESKLGKDTKYVDLDKLCGSLRVRNRKNGDIFTPFGMKGKKKLKDYFIDRKVPRDLRDEIPLIEDDENIIYILGMDINNNYRLDDKTKKILAINYEYNRR